MEGRGHGDLEAIRQMELKRAIEQKPRSSRSRHGRILTPTLPLIEHGPIQEEQGEEQSHQDSTNAVWPLVGLEEKICKSDEIVSIVKTITVCD